MTVPSRAGKRRIWTIGLLLVGMLLAAQTILLRLAQKAVREGDGGAAFALRPQNGWGAALHAEATLSRGDVAGAQRISALALDQTPYAAIAVRTLARTLERTDGPRAAERAWQVGSALGWRDKPTQLWAVLRALSNSEADIFAMRADALLRTPGDNRAMTSVVRQSLAVPAVRQAFIARLVQRPPWRGPFFDVDLPLQGKDLHGTALALFGLAGTGSEPSRRELADTIAGLIREGRYEEALRLDRMFVRRKADPGSLIDDGGFELAGTDYLRTVTPFDWVITDGAATLDRSGGRRSMAVTTDGVGGEAAVTRYAQFAPGAYALRYQAQGDAEAPAAVGVSISCVGAGAVLGTSDTSPLSGAGWQSRAVPFEVPSGCPLVRMAITPTRTDPGLNVLFDDFAVSPAGR